MTKKRKAPQRQDQFRQIKGNNILQMLNNGCKLRKLTTDSPIRIKDLFNYYSQISDNCNE